MEPRLYESSDAPAIDKMLEWPHDVRLDRDRLVVLGRPAGGLLIWRPGGIVHELRTGIGLGQKRRADLLVDFAIRDAVSQPFKLWEAIFITDSDCAAGYVKGLNGTTEEFGKRVFTMRIR